MTTSATETYQEALRNTHAMEKQGLTQMKAQVERLDAYKEYQALLRAHIPITERQIGRIEAEMEEAQAGGAGLREAVTTAAGAVGAAVHGIMPDETLKNLFAGYAYQHEQIAAYLSLSVLADEAGHGDHKAWIEETLSEERAAAKKVEDIIEAVTRQFVQNVTTK